MTYNISEAARLSGISVETIRYYERAGVVPIAERSITGFRTYTEQEIAILRFVRRCRDLGFQINEIKTLVTLSGDVNEVCSDVKAIGEAHLENIRARIAGLTKLETALTDLLQNCREGNVHCPALLQLFDE
jgi:DNA-binding transcriptional MerR regulator